MSPEESGDWGRHRGGHRDPVGTVLTGVWAIGHAVTVFLLGTAVVNQLDSGPHGLANTALSAPDREPLA
ncbi:hypothetical protein [Kitasatospora sp. NPDC094011]|uniref:hypothetical protein n=1 Tax=Kitasatospora sp. NPDC094011 TaxID=3364090 RepID=UPI0037F80F17